jgi:hypothetical protein
MAVNKSFVVKHGLRVGDSADITGTLHAAGLTYPTSDGSYNSVIKTDGNGNLSLGKIRMQDLQDVNLLSLSHGGLIIYDSALEQWVANKQLVQQTINGGHY